MPGPEWVWGQIAAENKKPVKAEHNCKKADTSTPGPCPLCGAPDCLGDDCHEPEPDPLACYHCSGRGHRLGEDCPHCDGTGEE